MPGRELIARVLAQRTGVPPLERELFATTDPEAIAGLVDAFCRERLHAGVARYELFASSAGSVHGVRLEDGRRVVVKVHPAGVDVGHLVAVQAVQRRLAGAGFPAPRPLLAPTPLASGVAVVEALLHGGERVDAHDPGVRRRVAVALVDLVELARPLGGLPGLVSWREARERLWRAPHDPRFAFAATAHGAAWIDRLGHEAHRRIDALDAGEPVVGHGDRRVEHLCFDGARLGAVFDWDSVMVAPAAVLAGSAAHAFTVDWGVPGQTRLPTRDEALAFLDDVQAARGAPFTPGEASAARAALVASWAYTARCEHSDALTGFGTHPAARAVPRAPAGSARALLARHGEELLAEVSPPGRP